MLKARKLAYAWRMAGFAVFAMAATPATAADFYAAPGGNDGNNCTAAASPCKTIQAAIDKAAANDTVHVAQGNFAFGSNRIVIDKAGLKLVGDNSPFDASSVPGAPVKAANASVLQAASGNAAGGGTSGMIWIKNAASVEVRNLYVEVDASGTFDLGCFCTLIRAKEGIVATGAVDGLVVAGNYLKIVSGSGAIGISVNLAAGADSSVPAGESRQSGQYVSLTDNVVEPNVSANAAPKRAIAMQNGVATISGNQVAATTQDMWIQSPDGGGAHHALDIHGNWFYGRLQLYLSSGGNLSATTIDGNHFTAPPSNVWGNGSEAHSLRVMGANGASPTLISNNEFNAFGGTYRALWVMSRPNVTIEGNTFTPAANQSDFTAIAVGNREVWNGLPAPNPYAVAIRGNTFNANGAPPGNKGKAILFVDDNDASGAASSNSAVIGGAQPNDANQFDAAIGWYIALDDRSCTAQNHDGSGGNCKGTASYAIGAGIAYSGGSNQSSQKRAFKWDVSAAGNSFGGISMPGMTQAQYDAVWAKTYDRHNAATNPAVGNVLYGYPPMTMPGTVAWGTLSFVYDGNVQTVTATLSEDGTPCTVSGTVGPNAGDYPVHADCSSTNYTASGDTTAHITKASGSVTWGNLDFTYDGTSPTVTATLTQGGSACTVSGTVGPNAGDYPVHADCSSTNYTASGDATAHIAKAGTQTTLSSQCMRDFVEGQPFTLQATVTGAGMPGGSVDFDDGAGNALCGPVSLDAGSAACTSSMLSAQGNAVQAYALDAHYTGDANHASGSAAATLQVRVFGLQEIILRDGFEAGTLDCPLE